MNTLLAPIKIRVTAISSEYIGSTAVRYRQAMKTKTIPEDVALSCRGVRERRTTACWHHLHGKLKFVRGLFIGGVWTEGHAPVYLTAAATATAVLEKHEGRRSSCSRAGKRTRIFFYRRRGCPNSQQLFDIRRIHNSFFHTQLSTVGGQGLLLFKQ